MIAKGLPRPVALTALLLAVVTVSGACAGSSSHAESSTPAASPSQTQSASPSVTPTATAAPSATPVVTPPPTVAPGQPWRGLTWSEPVQPDLPWVDVAASISQNTVANALPMWTSCQGKIFGLASLFNTQGSVVASSTDWVHWTTLAKGSALPFGIEQLLGLACANSSLVLLTVPTDAIGVHVWTSVDGANWTARDSRAFKGGTFSGMASGRSGLVVTGSVGSTRASEAVVWFSHDGLAWQEIRLPGNTRHDDYGSSVAAFAGGYSVVGQTGVTYPKQGGDAYLPGETAGDAAAWYSADGIHWKQAAVDGNDKEAGGMDKVYAASGGLMATGSLSIGGEPPSAAWTSKDGRQWKLAVDYRNPPADYQPSIPVWMVTGMDGRDNIWSDGQRMVALPYNNEGKLIAEVSLDGAHWQVLDETGAGLARRPYDDLPDVVVQPSGLIVFGTIGFAPQVFHVAALP